MNKIKSYIKKIAGVFSSQYFVTEIDLEIGDLVGDLESKN